jgi:hypothetical protein
MYNWEIQMFSCSIIENEINNTQNHDLYLLQDQKICRHL